MALTEQDIRQITDEIVKSLSGALKTAAPAASPAAQGGSGRCFADTAEESRAEMRSFRS